MTSDLMFSIVMPAYNEADAIEPTVAELCQSLDASGFRYELIVVNDASTDQTGAILKELSQKYPAIVACDNGGPNGYGHAIRRGLEIYCGDAAVVVTADGADAPKDVLRYFQLISDGHDCAFGNRFDPKASVTGYPPFKRVVNRMANWFLSKFAKSGKYRDFTNGFKCYRRHVIDDMQPLVSGQFNITIEMSLKAVLAGYKFAVVPNDWKQRDAGTSNFNVLRQFPPYFATLVYCLSRRYLLSNKR